MSDDNHSCNEYRHFTRKGLLAHAAQGGMRQVHIPEQLLEEGAGGFFDQKLSRRELLVRGGGLVMTAAIASQIPGLGILEQAAAADNGGPILVSIYLGGGNDGLNTLVPLTGTERTRYEGLRRRIALPGSKLLPLKDRGDLGWHPAASGLQQLYDAGKIAALPGVDYPNPIMSHFESEHYWRTGTLNSRENHGWLGRYLDKHGSGNPLEGIAVAWGGDGALNGASAATSSIADPGAFSMWTPGVWDADRLVKSWNGMSKGASKSPAHAALKRHVTNTVQTRAALKPFAKEKREHLPKPPVAYPENYELGKQLSTLGRLLSAGLGTKVATLHDSQSHDTHDDQLSEQGRNLENLSQALLAWQADLEARGLGNRVVTMVWSEFGRRAKDNEGGGTDHGAGGLLLLIGNRVQGGVYNDSWHLDSLDKEGCIQVATDFRDVYAGLLEGHLGAASRDVLPGYSGTPLKLVA